MKLTSNDVSAHEQADRLARACTAVGSAKLALGSRQCMSDFVFHSFESKPSQGLAGFRYVRIVNEEGFTADNIDHRSSVQIIRFGGVLHDEKSRPKQVRFLLGKRNCLWMGENDRRLSAYKGRRMWADEITLADAIERS